MKLHKILLILQIALTTISLNLQLHLRYLFFCIVV
jgi:hypothetical protein